MKTALLYLGAMLFTLAIWAGIVLFILWSIDLLQNMVVEGRF